LHDLKVRFSIGLASWPAAATTNLLLRLCLQLLLLQLKELLLQLQLLKRGLTRQLILLCCCILLLLFFLFYVFFLLLPLLLLLWKAAWQACLSCRWFQRLLLLHGLPLHLLR
jgi:hypothetical protein